MPYQIIVEPCYNVTIYSRAGASPNDNYNLYYSETGIDWTLVASSLNSTSCIQHSTVSICSGTIYLYAENDNDSTQVSIRGSNSSTCPANLNVTCIYSTAITGNEDVAITVYVDVNGDYEVCGV